MYNNFIITGCFVEDGRGGWRDLRSAIFVQLYFYFSYIYRFLNNKHYVILIQNIFDFPTIKFLENFPIFIRTLQSSSISHT